MAFIDQIEKLTKQLYPSGRAFKMPKDGFFQKLHDSLNLSEARAYTDAKAILGSILPDTDNFTEEDAAMWEQKLGMITNESVSLADRKAAIFRKMNHPGTIKARQSTLYIEGQLQEAGFNVQVHENRFDKYISSSVQGIINFPRWIVKSSAANNNWRAIAYGNGIFVAVSTSGSGNRVMTSPDGETWTLRSSAADLSWRGIVFANGLFVAVADSGSSGNQIMTSPDGTTWTLRNADSDTNWNAIAYGNGRFVAVGSLDILQKPVTTSLNGISWVGNSLGTAIDLNTIVFANGLFVGLGNDSCWTSPDGLVWTARTSPPGSNNWTSITYGNGLFVAVSDSGTGDRVMTSVDGITWTSRVSPVDNDWKSVVFYNGMFIAVAETGTNNRAMISFDGITWETMVTEPDNDWQAVAAGGGIFVAVSKTGTGNRVLVYDINQRNICVNHIDEDIDALFLLGDSLVSTFFIGGALTKNIDLSSQSTGISMNATNGCFGNGLFVLLENGSKVITSYDGIVWTQRAAISSSNWVDIVFGDNLFVAITSGASGFAVMTSTDGITWTAQTTPVVASGSWFSIAYGNGVYVVIGTGPAGPTPGKVMTSSDGITWSLGTLADVTPVYSAITFGNGLFVAVGSGGKVQTSPDGITWTVQTSADSDALVAIVFAKSLFVALTQTGKVQTSPDGITWTLRTGVNFAWIKMAYGNGIFIAIDGSSPTVNIMTSEDGITWTAHTDTVSSGLRSIVYGDGIFISQISGSSVYEMYYPQIAQAEVDADRKNEFRQLILKLKPAQTSAFLFVDYV